MKSAVIAAIITTQMHGQDVEEGYTMFTVRARTVVVVTLIACLVMPMLMAVPSAVAQEEPPRIGLHPFAEGYALHGPYWVGTRQLVIEPEAERPLPLTVWYPALNPDGAAEAVTYTYQAKWIPGPDFTPTVAGHALQDAAPDMVGAPYPLLVFSPGWGTNPASYANLLEHTASYGFVVLAPDHPDHVYFMQENPFSEVPISAIENPRDITRVLDYAASLTADGGTFAGLLDLKRVAVAGHSSGGQTALAAGGARIDLPAFNARCAAARAAGDPSAWLCDPFEPFEAEMAALAGLDAQPEGLWPSWGDPRVDAIITMAGDSYLFGPDGLAAISIPLLALGGSADTGTPVDWGIRPAFDHASSTHKALVLLDGAEHGIVANSCASSPWLVDIGLGFQCADAIWDKLRANDLVNHFATAFLLATLTGDTEAAAALAPEAAVFPGITYSAQGFPMLDTTVAATVARDGTPVLSAEEILGTWRWQLGMFHFQFRADGTFRANQSYEGLDADTVEDLGTYQVQNGVLTLTSGETTRFCRPGEVGVYTVYRAEGEDQLALVVREEACYMRAPSSPRPQLFNQVD
ncbi:MAG: hypothetical protein HPY64_02705 [Anaerolineae bacterium]|nr:hypothetical protein [Anaerolineae bacterium]